MFKLVKSIGNSFVAKLGVRVVRLPNGTSYERIVPTATYAPWNCDPAFLSTYAEVKNHTFVDVYRCWELWTLVRQTAKLEGSIIEIGVWRGGTGAIMAKEAALLGIDDFVYLCDTFRGVVKAGSNDPTYKGGEHADTSREIVEALVHEQMHLDKVRILEGIFPDETAPGIESVNPRFRLCHIDVDTYDSARDIMKWIWNRMVINGIVVFDDYGYEVCQGVAKFVNEQMDLNDRFVFHNLNGHAIVVKLKH